MLNRPEQEERASLLLHQNLWHSYQPFNRVRSQDAIKATISDNNIGQWLPFPPYPLPNVVLQVQKKYRKKRRHHCSNIERGEAGEGFCLRVARDFWLRLYSLYMLGISMGLYQACHVIDFQKDIIKTAKRKQT